MDLMKELAKRYNAHDAMLQALKLIQLNARTALEYARKEGNDIAAAARLANIENWPGFVAAKKAISKAERNR